MHKDKIKIFQIHNRYRLVGGEETVVHELENLLQRRGHKISTFYYDSSSISIGLAGKMRVFFSGMFSLSAYREVSKVIKRAKPDIVHVHNLFPLFSPWVLQACRKAGTRVVMTVHNFRLTCPIGLHFRKGKICEHCLHGKDYWCIIKNCRGNLFESFAFALWNYSARAFDLYRRNVNMFLALTDFSAKRLRETGIDERRITVMPNPIGVDGRPMETSKATYGAYVGRISEEKGVETLLKALSREPAIDFCLAGDGPLRESLARRSPSNAIFLGQIPYCEMDGIYSNCRFLVLPSNCYEGSPMAVLEAMGKGIPVIASAIGGLSEFIEDGVTGFLVEPRNHKQLAEKMSLLWKDDALCLSMGRASYEKARNDYGKDIFYRRLNDVYEKVLGLTH